MRAMIKFGAVAILFLLAQGVSEAAPLYEGPWCAVYQGRDAGVWRCTFSTLEACTQEVIAGNRGFCNHNPSWSGPPPRVRKRFVRRH